MANSKISVSLDEVNSSSVDAELHRTDVAERMAQHQAMVQQTQSKSAPASNRQGLNFRSAVVYMTIFGLVGAIIAWGLGEIVCQNDNLLCWLLWSISVSSIISSTLSSAEAFMSKNMNLAVKNIVLGALFGALGGIVMIICGGRVYNVLGGGQADYLPFQQILARGITWGLLGGFIAMAPGIIMKSRKKFMLGVAGGVIGGCYGGFLFDPICVILESDVFARFVNLISLSVGTAVAIVLLENIAKQGWLKVVSGLIAGKQFILYRNPTVIGSSPKSEIYLFKDPSISPKHAAINNVNGDFIITAIDSSPVLVNNSPVRQEKLKTGDRIQIGSTTFIFEAKVIKNK